MQGKGARPYGCSSRPPKFLRPFFWDHDFGRLTLEADLDLIVGRILAVGDWHAIQWLRKFLGKERLRTWIESRQGGGLSARQLRFWELILDIRRAKVTAWIRDPRRQTWEGRRHL